MRARVEYFNESVKRLGILRKKSGSKLNPIVGSVYAYRGWFT